MEHPGRNEARPEPPDWSVRGNRGNTAKSPGVRPVPRTGTSGDAVHPDWNDRGLSGPGMEGPGQQTRRRRRRRSNTERRTRTRARNRRGRTRRREDAKREEKEQEVGSEGRRRRRGGRWAHGARTGTDQSGGDTMAERRGKSKVRWGGRTRRTRARGKRRRRGRKNGLTLTETRMQSPGAPRGREGGGRKKQKGSHGELAQEQARMREGERKHAWSTQRARAPLNRRQEAQDTAHTAPHTKRAHR